MENIITTSTSSSTTTFLEEIKPKKNPLTLSRKPSEKVTLKKRRHNNAKKIKVENNKKLEDENEEDEDEDEEDDDEKPEEVEQKIMALKRIVPGGESLGADKLFEETADYILALQFQVKALKFLTSFVEGSSEMEKRKLGG